MTSRLGDPPSAAPHDEALPGARELLVQVSEHLLEAVGSPIDPLELDEIADVVSRRHPEIDDRTWPAVMETLARNLGLRVVWQVGPTDEVVARVGPGLPMVTVVEDRWIVVDGLRGQFVKWQALPGGSARRSKLPAFSREVGEHARSWALLEPALPGSVLAGPNGDKLPPMRRLLGLLRAEREDVGIVVVYAVGVSLLGLATPVAVQVLVNTVAFGAFRQPVIVLAGMLFVCLGLASLLRGLQGIVVEVMQRRLFARMVLDLAHRLPRVPLSRYDAVNGPELVNRFFDVLTVQKAMRSLLVDALGVGLQAATGMLVLALYHPALLGYDVLLLACIAALLLGFGRSAEKTAIKESKAKYAVAAWLEEVAAHPELFKLAGGADHALSRADALARNYLSSRERHFSNWFRQYAGALVLLAVANTALLAGGAWLVLERQLTLGQLVAAEFIVASVLLGFSKLAEKLETFYDLLAAVDKLGQLVDLPVESASSEADPRRSAALGLHLEGVCAQPLQPGTSLSLELTPGEEIAVVGGEASGKSVLADLMVGLRPLRKGSIYYDGVDRRDIDLERLRDHIVLLRRPDMVTGSLSDNVRFGRTEVSVRDVRDALQRVGLTRTVERLPQGLRTPVNPRGAPLASGERIRLAVARALVGNPRLIVVDGMLDGLDPALQDALLGALHGPGTPWTFVLLTTDPSLARRVSPAPLLLQHGELSTLA